MKIVRLFTIVVPPIGQHSYNLSIGIGLMLCLALLSGCVSYGPTGTLAREIRDYKDPENEFRGGVGDSHNGRYVGTQVIKGRSYDHYQFQYVLKGPADRILDIFAPIDSRGEARALFRDSYVLLERKPSCSTNALSVASWANAGRGANWLAAGTAPIPTRASTTPRSR